MSEGEWVKFEKVLKELGCLDDRIERIGRESGRLYGRQFFREQAKLMAGPDSGCLARELERFQDGEPIERFSHDILAAHLRDVDVDLSRYSAVRDIRRDASLYAVNFPTKMYDGTFAVGLCRDDELVAWACFEPLFGGVRVSGLQGVRGVRDALAPVDWKGALVDYVRGFASWHGIPDVYVQSVDNNLWAVSTFSVLKRAGFYGGLSFADAKRVSHSEEEDIRRQAMREELDVHLMPRQGHRIYDRTAQRMGFLRVPRGDYVFRS